MSHGQQVHRQHANKGYDLSGRCYWAGCGAKGCEKFVTFNGDGHLPPIAIFKRFQALGWIIGERNAKHNRCPDCQSARGQKVNPNVELLKMAENVRQISEVRAATPIEFRKIQTLLDDHFDEGTYLDGYDDERVAKEVNVPRALVTKVREEAWGPIKIDPIGRQILDEIEVVKSQIAEIEARVTKWVAGRKAS